MSLLCCAWKDQIINWVYLRINNLSKYKWTNCRILSTFMTNKNLIKNNATQNFIAEIFGKLCVVFASIRQLCARFNFLSRYFTWSADFLLWFTTTSSHVVYLFLTSRLVRPASFRILLSRNSNGASKMLLLLIQWSLLLSFRLCRVVNNGFVVIKTKLHYKTLSK